MVESAPIQVGMSKLDRADPATAALLLEREATGRLVRLLQRPSAAFGFQQRIGGKARPIDAPIKDEVGLEIRVNEKKGRYPTGT